MSNRIFSLFGKKSELENATTLLKFDIEGGISETPLLQTNDTLNLEIPIIGVGSAGCKIADLVAERLKKYNVDHPVMGIDFDKNELLSYSNLKATLHLESKTNSTAKQYLVAEARANEQHDIIRSKVSDYLSSVTSTHNDEIVFILLGGGGGTGVGVSNVLAQILVKMGRKPVPIVILPSDDESTRAKFNAAVALYKFSYAPIDRCLNLTSLIFDNELFHSINSTKKISLSIDAINERIASTIADTFIATEIVPSGYTLDLNEFIEVFRQVKGLGVFTYAQIEGEANFPELYKYAESTANSLDVDLSSGTRSFLFVQTAEEQLTSEEYRKVINKFNSLDAFPKLSEIGSADFIALRGITTGIKLPQKIIDFMEYAESVKVSQLQKEVRNAKTGKGNVKIDKLTTDDGEIDVRDSEEMVS